MSREALAVLTIPWVDARLSPNARKHWRVKSEAVSEARQYARITAAVLCGDYTPKDCCLNVNIAPPDKRRRDVDNVLASLKPTIDGMADALGIDDNTITKIVIVKNPPVKGGKVELWITEN